MLFTALRTIQLLIVRIRLRVELIELLQLHRKPIILRLRGRDRAEMKTHHKRLTFGRKV